MTMHTPPENQGQIVEVSYGSDNSGTLYRRTLDRSDGSVTWDSADASDCGCVGECNCFEPWNREPTAYDWSPCASPEDED